LNEAATRTTYVISIPPFLQFPRGANTGVMDSAIAGRNTPRWKDHHQVHHAHQHSHYTEKERFLATGRCGDTLEGFRKGMDVVSLNTSSRLLHFLHGARAHLMGQRISLGRILPSRQEGHFERSMPETRNSNSCQDGMP